MLRAVTKEADTMPKRRANMDGYELPVQCAENSATYLSAERKGGRSAAENKKRLSHTAAVGRRDRRPESTEVQSGWQRVNIPIADRRPHVTGQRSAHAPESAEASGAATHPLPRPAPHLRNDSIAKRRGRKNSVLDAGPLLRGIHIGHLRHVTTDAQLKAAQTMGNILSRAV